MTGVGLFLVMIKSVSSHYSSGAIVTCQFAILGVILCWTRPELHLSDTDKLGGCQMTSSVAPSA